MSHSSALLSQSTSPASRRNTNTQPNPQNTQLSPSTLQALAVLFPHLAYNLGQSANHG